MCSFNVRTIFGEEYDKVRKICNHCKFSLVFTTLCVLNSVSQIYLFCLLKIGCFVFLKTLNLNIYSLLWISILGDDGCVKDNVICKCFFPNIISKILNYEICLKFAYFYVCSILCFSKNFEKYLRSVFISLSPDPYYFCNNIDIFTAILLFTIWKMTNR